MKRCVIISGGEFFSDFKVAGEDYLIACDKGYDYALEMSLVPDLVLGDFDSVSADYKSANEFITLPREKDDTDTFFALKLAIEKGFKNIDIYCALGARIDHMYANISLLNYCAKNAIRCRMIDADNVMMAISDDEIDVDRMDGYAISVFSLSDKSEGIYYEGLRYPLDNATMRSSYPIGVSNEWISDKAKIRVDNGCLLIIASRV